jgi:hypothetical protein
MIRLLAVAHSEQLAVHEMWRSCRMDFVDRMSVAVHGILHAPPLDIVYFNAEFI